MRQAALLIAVLAASAPAAAAPDQAQAGKSRSEIVFRELEQDIGTIYQHEETVIEFPFDVVGPDPVVLRRHSREKEVYSNCGCTSTWVRPDWLIEDGDVEAARAKWQIGQPIPAGATATIVATFSASRYTNERETVIQLRGDQANGVLTLTVYAEVLPVFVARPTTLAFGEVLEPALRSADPVIDVELVGRAAFELLRWKRLPTGVEVAELGEAELLDDGRMRRRLRFTLGSKAPIGQLQGAAIAETSLGVDLEILASGRVVSAVRFDPERRLHFGLPKEGKQVSRTVTVDLMATGVTLPVPIVELGGDVAEHMTVEVRTRDEGKAYDVVVKSVEGMPAGRYRGTLAIRFPEGSGFQGHQMPISITVRSKSSTTR